MRGIETTKTRATALALMVALAACGETDEPAESDHGHEHGGATAVTLWQDSLELFYEHPPFVAGADGEPWTIHVTRLATYEPVREGTLRLRLAGPGGETVETVADAPAREGIFTPAPSVPSPGTWSVTMMIELPGHRATIEAPAVEAYPSEAAIPHEEEDEGGGGIAYLKEQQWEVPFRTVEARRGSLTEAVSVHAEIAAPVGSRAVVSAPVDGLVRAGGPDRAPGEWVTRGRALARLAPVGGDDGFAELRARVERLETEVARAERLLAVEAIPAKRLEDARRELAVARSQLDALGETSGTDYTVRAPITGEIQSRSAAPGERVAAGDRLFTIVDPRTVWLEMKVPARHAPRANLATGATFRVEGGDALRTVDRLVSVGDVLDPESRTVVVRGVVDNGNRALKVGMLAEAFLLLGEPVTGTVVPAEAIRDEDGAPVAYVQTGGESFERRTLELGSSDGAETIVERGVEPGERVVTVGAYQVRLAAVGDEEIGDHGHPH